MKPILFPVWVCFIDGYVYGNGTISTATGVFTSMMKPMRGLKVYKHGKE